MGCSSNGSDFLNHFALVSYLPKTLAVFLDDLRLELSPNCNPHAHVTLLPPRPVKVEPERVAAEIRQGVTDFPAFEITLGEVEVFQKSHVIYISIAKGAHSLRELYRALNQKCVRYQGPFEYHPHITVAQHLEESEVAEALEIAKRRWASYTGPRTFRVDTLALVQNQGENQWRDLADFPLPTPSLR